MISKDRIAEVLALDEGTGVLRWQVAKRPGGRGTIAGHVRKNGYVQVVVDGKVFAAHRLVWLLVHGHWPDADIDHVNGVRSDNRPSNLRACTRTENMQNRGVGKNSRSGIVGVSWNTRAGKWRAAIQANKRHFDLGLFDSKDAAATAYAAAKRKLHKFNPIPRSESVQPH